MGKTLIDLSSPRSDVPLLFRGGHEGGTPATCQVLILTMPHGAAHQRVANALARAMRATHPEVVIEVSNALSRFPPWFRAYYNSYEIPLRYWPDMWGWIESIQHTHASSGPGWLFRKVARDLSRFLEATGPDVVIVTEAGICELAAIAKRSSEAGFYLVAVPPGVDLDRAWRQPEVDLYVVAPGEAAAKLRAFGVPEACILACGVPIDPRFASLPNLATARERLGIASDGPLVLVQFGGAGYGNPRQILTQLKKLGPHVRVVCISGKNRSLENELLRLSRSLAHVSVLGWVDNIHEWMAAADLLVGKPGGTTMVEAISSGLPLLAFDPLPGEERRNCELIEKWGVGYWVKRAQDLAPSVARLLANHEERQCVRARALALAHPQAARVAAEVILQRWQDLR